MNTQTKFEKRLATIADNFELDLVIDKTYGNLGTYSFQRPGSFLSLMKFPFSWQGQSASFDHRNLHDSDTTILSSYVGHANGNGSPWIAVSGGLLDDAIGKISMKLDELLVAEAEEADAEE